MQKLKNLNLPTIAILIIIAYLAFERLFEKSESQRLIIESEKKANAAIEANNKAIKRIEAIQTRLDKIDNTTKQLNQLSESTLLYIQEVDTKYNAQRDSINKVFNQRLHIVKKQLSDLKKLQETL